MSRVLLFHNFARVCATDKALVTPQDELFHLAIFLKISVAQILLRRWKQMETTKARVSLMNS